MDLHEGRGQTRNCGREHVRREQPPRACASHREKEQIATIHTSDESDSENDSENMDICESDQVVNELISKRFTMTPSNFNSNPLLSTQCSSEYAMKSLSQPQVHSPSEPLSHQHFRQHYRQYPCQY